VDQLLPTSNSALYTYTGISDIVTRANDSTKVYTRLKYIPD